MISEEAFRAPMRARQVDAGQFEGARYGVTSGLVGIGEQLGLIPVSESAAILATAETYGDKAARMLARFMEVPDGSFVWTQTGEGEFRLGRIAGPWRYEPSGEAGIHQLRPAQWLSDPFTLESTPVPVIDTFARGGKNFQRIRDPATAGATASLWPR